MVADDAQTRFGVDRVHDQAQDVDDPRPAVDEVTEEHDGPALRMTERSRRLRQYVAEPLEQLLQLVETAVDVTDDVERPPIGPVFDGAGPHVS
jgi:hypothetical protein